MTREVLLAQLRATYATLVAAQEQVGASVLALEAEEEATGEDDAAVECPRCKGHDLAEAGTDKDGARVHVCATCGANVAAGRVIGG